MAKRVVLFELTPAQVLRHLAASHGNLPAGAKAEPTAEGGLRVVVEEQDQVEGQA